MTYDKTTNEEARITVWLPTFEAHGTHIGIVLLDRSHAPDLAEVVAQRRSSQALANDDSSAFRGYGGDRSKKQAAAERRHAALRGHRQTHRQGGWHNDLYEYRDDGTAAGNRVYLVLPVSSGNRAEHRMQIAVASQRG